MAKNSKLREILFLHLDGIPLISISIFLMKNNFLKSINNQSLDIDGICKKFNSNKAYTNICLRTLWSAGFIGFNKNNKKYSIDQEYYNILNNEKEVFDDFSNLINEYKNLNLILKKDSNSEKLIYFLNKCNMHLISLKNKLDLNRSKHKFIYYYFEGILIGPILSFLGFNKVIKNSKINFDSLNNLKKIITDIFIINGFIKKDSLINTSKGDFFFNRTASYGVTVSYLEIFTRLDDLIFNNIFFIWERNKSQDEIHVDRSMNVWGSGGAHKFYFNKIDEIIVKIFNQKIESQPKGIIDIGCGDGAFLEHVYDLIINNTIRKDFIKQFPLKLVGVDLNKAAIKASKNRLKKRNLDYIIIEGNISNPSSINNNLKINYNLYLNDLLNARTFLDHNRIYSNPKNNISLSKKSYGGFCYKGAYISSNKLGNNLIEHFLSWKPYISKYGIILLELHTIHPDMSNKFRGKNLSCAYDATHGFSDQYLVEYDFFLYCAKKAGLMLNNNFTFPNEEIPTISISYFK